MHSLRAVPAGNPQIEPSFSEIARQWGRIGCTGFGGPPAHIALFRELCVVQRAWLTDEQFERALAAVNLLPGPASTQLSIYCAWRLRGRRGGDPPRNITESTRIIKSPGRMKQSPPSNAPRRPRSRHAQ